MNVFGEWGTDGARVKRVKSSDFKFLYLVALGPWLWPQDLVPDQGSIWTPCIGSLSLSLWTTRKVPTTLNFILHSVVVIDMGQWLDLLDHSDSSSTHGPLNPWCKKRYNMQAKEESAKFSR